jgi:hypothetical protein
VAKIRVSPYFQIGPGRYITIKSIPRQVKPNNFMFEEGFMEFFQIVVGCVMGFYLMVIVMGH